MGNFLQQPSEDGFVYELSVISNGMIDVEKIERIKMNSFCKDNLVTVKELVVLYKRFIALDAKGRGSICNAEFLNLGEFMHNPLKSRLKQAIPLRPDEFILGFTDFEKSLEERVKSPTNDSKSHTKYSDNPWKGVNYVTPEKKQTEVTLENPIDGISYIDFEMFCSYLSVFCPRTPMDRKTNCNPQSVLFKIFDADDDGKLSREDLEDTLKLMLGTESGEVDLESLIDKVFEEVDSSEKNFIDKDGNSYSDFAKVMWMTNFDQKCSFYF
jgi:Ca2+-binding EF-hand superfamily protein